MQNSCSAQKLHGLAAFITKEVPFKGALAEGVVIWNWKPGEIPT